MTFECECLECDRIYTWEDDENNFICKECSMKEEMKNKLFEREMMLPKCVIIDCDGTLANIDHRRKWIGSTYMGVGVTWITY